jgi:hypothetical protein
VLARGAPGLPLSASATLNSSARSPTCLPRVQQEYSSGPLDPNYGGETGLQRFYFPLIHIVFFRETLRRDGGSLAYWEEIGGEGGGLNEVNVLWSVTEMAALVCNSPLCCNYLVTIYLRLLALIQRV